MSTLVPTPNGKTFDLQRGAILSMSDIVADVQDSADSNLSRLVSAMFRKPASIGAVFDINNVGIDQTAFRLSLVGSTYSDIAIYIDPGTGLTSTHKLIKLAKRMTIESDGVNGLAKLLSDCHGADITEVDIYIQLVRWNIPSANGGEETNLKNGLSVTAGEDAGKLTVDQVGADPAHFDTILGAPLMTSKNCYWFKIGSVEYGDKDNSLFLLYPLPSGMDVSNIPDQSKDGSIIRIGGLRYNGSSWILWRNSEAETGCAIVAKNFI